VRTCSRNCLTSTPRVMPAAKRSSAEIREHRFLAVEPRKACWYRSSRTSTRRACWQLAVEAVCWLKVRTRSSSDEMQGACFTISSLTTLAAPASRRSSMHRKWRSSACPRQPSSQSGTAKPSSRN
jgi:hypothetical protein